MKNIILFLVFIMVRSTLIFRKIWLKHIVKQHGCFEKLTLLISLNRPKDITMTSKRYLDNLRHTVKPVSPTQRLKLCKTNPDSKVYIFSQCWWVKHMSTFLRLWYNLILLLSSIFNSIFIDSFFSLHFNNIWQNHMFNGRFERATA